jgi:predicted nucleic acid-binding protein
VIEGEFVLLPFESSEPTAVLDAFSAYHDDQQVDFADAVLLALAEREQIEVVFTLDRRHFGLFRKRSGSALRLLPESL